MKILVDGLPLFGKWQKGGVGHYTQNLLSQTAKLDASNDYSVWHWDRSSAQPIKAPNLSYRALWYFPLKGYNLLLRQFVAPPIDLLLRVRPDLVLFTNFVRFPLAFGEKSIVVVYDLSFILAGEHAGARSRRYLTKWVPKSIAAADQVVTISENSKKEIIEHYGTDPKKITVIGPAVDHDRFKPASLATISELRKRLELPDQYILFIGTVEPRKNLVGLLDAYSQLPSELQKTYPLVLAGGKGWQDEAIQAKFGQLKSQPIIQLGYVAEDDLPTLYSGASVFVFPSFYEGFGMPPLEAMACGVPVITANNSSLPEVVGDAAILIDAQDTSGLSRAIVEVLTNPEKAAKMKTGGLKQAQKFNWADSAQQFVQLINKVGQQ